MVLVSPVTTPWTHVQRTQWLWSFSGRVEKMHSSPTVFLLPVPDPRDPVHPWTATVRTQTVSDP